MDCKKDKNMADCNCTYPCSKKGICCDCIAYHRKSGQLPACYFPDDIEKGFNRSIENFIETYKKRSPWWN